MEIVVNSQAEALEESVSIQAYLEKKGLDCRGLVVQHNGEIIPADALANVTLRDGDRVELIKFVGGG